MNPVLQKFLADHPGRDLDREGLRLHYIDEGSGDPVVMLHGNPTWSFYYRTLIGDLGDSCRVIVPDHIGCGLSDMPDDSRYDYTLASRVDDLERLLDHLGLVRGLTLVLHDWGGILGMAFAARHPERIARLVVANTAAFHKPPGKSFPWRSRSSATRPSAAGWSEGSTCSSAARPGSGARIAVCRGSCATLMPHRMIHGPIGSPSTVSSRISPCGRATAVTR